MGILNESDKIAAAECATAWRARVGPHSAACDCAGCDAQYRQGRTLASVKASATGFLFSALGIVALLVVAWVKSKA